jgi:hypothetical protein
MLLPLVLVASGVVLLLLASGRLSPLWGSQPSPSWSPSNGPSMLTGFRYADESGRILDVAESFGIDPRFLAALRQAEGGGPGREFGVLSVSAPTYDEQIDVAARTIRNNLARYEDAMRQSPIGDDGRYTTDFIRWFSARYAPIGADNDPGHLNEHHAGNLIAGYSNIEVA